MFKIKYFQRFIFFIVCLVSSSFINANQEASEFTPIEVCEQLTVSFDKKVFAAFVEVPESAIKFVFTRQANTNVGQAYVRQGCNIESWVHYKLGKKEIGGILLYRQSNSLAVYNDHKRIHLKAAGSVFTKNDKSFFQTFPWFEEGFLGDSGKYNTFHAYTSKNDYIVFLFNSEFDPELKELSSKRTNKTMVNKFTKRFIEFITIFTDQLYL